MLAPWIAFVIGQGSTNATAVQIAGGSTNALAVTGNQTISGTLTVTGGIGQTSLRIRVIRIQTGAIAAGCGSTVAWSATLPTAYADVNYTCAATAVNGTYCVTVNSKTTTSVGGNVVNLTSTAASFVYVDLIAIHD